MPQSDHLDCVIYINLHIRTSNEYCIQIKKFEEDKKAASKTGFTMKVNELNEQVRKYTAAKETFQEEVAQMKDLLSDVREKLKTVDARLKQLRPTLRLETLEDRCECL